LPSFVSLATFSQNDQNLLPNKVTARFNLRSKLDMAKLAETFAHMTSPRTNKFRGLVFKIASPKSTFLVFENGQVVCVGARDQYHALQGARRLVRLFCR